MATITVILFKDGTCQFYNKRQDKSDFQEGTRFFEVAENMPVYKICDWYGRGCQSQHFKEYNT